MAPSTKTPTDIAMPESDIMLEVSFIPCKKMKESKTEIGMVTIGTMADGKCQRKRRMTKLTMIISSIN